MRAVPLVTARAGFVTRHAPPAGHRPAGNKAPPHQTSFFGRIEALFGTVELYAEYVSERDRYYNLDNNHKAENKKEINFGVSYLFRSVLLSLEGKNITDEDYEDFNGYPLPGTAYYVTVKYEFL